MNADGTMDQAIQTYHSTHTDVQNLLRDIRLKASVQLSSAPARVKVLAVHTSREMAAALAVRSEDLRTLSARLRVRIDVVSSDARLSYGGAR
jgi:hypothetical protein